MKYIRFLKVPRYQDGVIRATISIASDLGETFLEEDVDCTAVVCSADRDGEIYLRKKFVWKNGMRALPITFDVTSCDIDWPVQVRVSPKNSPIIDPFMRHVNGTDLPSVCSVYSDILDPPNGINEASRTVERRFMPLTGKELRMWEETGESIARHLWDGGIAITAYLDRMVSLQTDGLHLLETSLGSATYKKLNVLELGCGVGIVGISLAQNIPDCQVILTDLPEATEIVKRNIDSMNTAMSSSVSFMPLDWEEPIPDKIAGKVFDIIVVSECTYNTTTIPALVKTLSALVKKSPKAILLLATKVRHGDEAMFHDLLAEADFVKASQTRLPLPKGESTNEIDEEVEVYLFHEKRNSLINKTHNISRPVVRFWDDEDPSP